MKRTESVHKSPCTHRQIQKASWQHKNAIENIDFLELERRYLVNELRLHKTNIEIIHAIHCTDSNKVVYYMYLQTMH